MSESKDEMILVGADQSAKIAVMCGQIRAELVKNGSGYVDVYGRRSEDMAKLLIRELTAKGKYSAEITPTEEGRAHIEIWTKLPHSDASTRGWHPDVQTLEEARTKSDGTPL
jgi:hypothetical protein